MKSQTEISKLSISSHKHHQDLVIINQCSPSKTRGLASVLAEGLFLIHGKAAPASTAKYRPPALAYFDF